MAIKVICNRCGKEIDANTYSFSYHQQLGYGSVHDGDELSVDPVSYTHLQIILAASVRFHRAICVAWLRMLSMPFRWHLHVLQTI